MQKLLMYVITFPEFATQNYLSQKSMRECNTDKTDNLNNALSLTTFL